MATNTSVSLDADLSGLDCRKAHCEEALAARLMAQQIATDVRESVDWLPSDTPRGQFQQGVAARGLTVKGRLQFGVMPRQSAGGEPGRIPGPVDLTGANIGTLEMCGDVFRDDPTRPDDHPENPDLTFLGARIGLFDLTEPFPEQMNMTGLRVERWHGLKGDGYLPMLGCMVPLDTSVYTAVEQALRLEGNDRLADRIYVAMRRRTRRDGPVIWRRLLFEWFLDGATGYWTAPHRLLLPIALSLAVSWGIANAPENYVPSGPGPAPATPAELCASSPLVRAMNYAIPVIDWVLDPGDNNADRCRLKQTSETRLALVPSRLDLVPAWVRIDGDPWSAGLRFELSPLVSALVIRCWAGCSGRCCWSVGRCGCADGRSRRIRVC